MQTFVRRRVHLNLSIVLFASIIALIVMSDSESTVTAAETTPEGKVHIIYTEKPTGNEDPKAYHLRTLSSALGSEQAAKDALIYSYKEAASGFSAKLTPEQVTEMSKQPGVIQVVPSQTYQLHRGAGGFQMH